MVWQGLTMKSIKHHYSLGPLYVATVAGAAFAAFYIYRLTQNIDASFNKTKNPHPWQKVKPDQNIKFMGAGKIDFKTLKKAGPDF